MDEIALSELSRSLYQEQACLDDLLYRVEQEQALLSTSRTRWLARATAEVAQALSASDLAGRERDAAARAAASRFGLHPAATLAELAGVVPEAWQPVLLAHRRELGELAGRLREAGARSREVLALRMAATEAALAMLGRTTAGIYRRPAGTAGAPVRAPLGRRASVLDEAV